MLIVGGAASIANRRGYFILPCSYLYPGTAAELQHNLVTNFTKAIMATRLSIILKDGFLYKKGGLIKSWSRRYFVLSPHSLCYFRSAEEHQAMEPLGRIFLSDIVSISTEGTEKKKAFVFVLHTKKRALLLQGANNEDRDKWVETIQKSLENDKEAENKDPFRKSLRRLTPGGVLNVP